MTNLLDGTTEFMRLGGQMDGVPVFPDSESSWSDKGRMLRINLLEEEFDEYKSAEINDDVVEIVDGLLDVIVIAWGTLLAYVGEEKALAAAQEVVRSNLSKVDGSLGPIVRRDDGKLLKPAGWTPPNIEGALS